MTTRRRPPAADRGHTENGSEQASVLALSVPGPGDEWLYRPPRRFGCPAGCALGAHKCGVGEPIGNLVDYLDSAVWHDGRLMSVRFMRRVA